MASVPLIVALWEAPQGTSQSFTPVYSSASNRTGNEGALTPSAEGDWTCMYV